VQQRRRQSRMTDRQTDRYTDTLSVYYVMMKIIILVHEQPASHFFVLVNENESGCLFVWWYIDVYVCWLGWRAGWSDERYTAGL